MDNQLNSHLGEIIFGTFFIVIALGAFTVSLIRRDRNARTLFWLGMWSGTYALRLIINCPPVNSSFPQWLYALVPWIDIFASYFILTFALLTWLDFTRNRLRRFLMVMLVISLLIALAGISEYVITHDNYYFTAGNQFAAAITLIVLIIVICIPSLANRFMLLPQRGIMALATLLFAAEALYTNTARFFHLPAYSETGCISV